MTRLRTAAIAVCTAALLGAAACTPTAETTTTPTTDVPESSTTTTGAPEDIAAVLEVEGPSEPVAAYGKAEFVIDVDADFENPFDQREVAVDMAFTGASGTTIVIPGFWDGDQWLVRFTPDEAGEWIGQAHIQDHRGTGTSADTSFTVEPSDHHGFVRVGSDVDPSFSPHYFAYEDGTPWYGLGHADLDMSFGGAATDGTGLRKMQKMKDSKENFEMWWPFWTNNIIADSYDNYLTGPASTIDWIVGEAEKNGIGLAFNIWGHQFLRTGDHNWPDAMWGFNGFSQGWTIDEFFVDEEAWAWQENFYRYVIARWSYSPSIVMWQTITEINGTESYGQTDTWHNRLNAYFQTNDPYQHPTTATGSGHWDWPSGHRVMDVTQNHLYEVFVENPIRDGATVGEWVRKVFLREDKPTWIGEYGIRGYPFYPEMSHYANWANLGAGGATTPIEWNDGYAYNTFTDEMAADSARLADFVEALPLVHLAPEPVDLSFSNEHLRGWGVVGEQGGVVWIQDFALEDKDLDTQRAGRLLETTTVEIDGLGSGSWLILPYNTWTGEWMDDIIVECGNGPCAIDLPTFTKDIALAFQR